MAPKAWSDGSVSESTRVKWCDNTSSYITGAVGTDVGDGDANTTAMQSPACTSEAGVSARAYRGGGFSDWFLPSADELMAMYLYSQAGGFNSVTYGFVSDYHWSSTQSDASNACLQNFDDGFAGCGSFKYGMRFVRPIRAF